MKKLFTVIAAAFIAVAANAQFYAGGNVGFQTGDRTYINIAPEAGYNFNDQFAVGAVVGFSHQEDLYSAITLNPYVRWTFADWSPIKLFLDGSFAFSSITVDKNFLGQEKTYSAMQFGVKPGIALPLNEQLSLVAHLGFVGFAAVDENVEFIAEYADGFGAHFGGNDLTFGIYYNF